MNSLLKKSSVFFTLFLIISISYAQTKVVKPHQKVVDAFGSKHITFLQQNYPDSVLFYNFLLEGSFKVLKKEEYNKEKLNNLEEININNSWIIDKGIDFKKFNVLLTPVKPDSAKDKFYKIAETDFILLLKSKEYNNKKFEGYKALQK